MPISLPALVQDLDQYLQPGRFQDYCPNGLQVEGCSSVARIVTGVSANQALIDRAIECEADAILVHHGYFWKGEADEIVGMKRRRLAALLGNNISLLAYHLPLDAHPEVGNNACFGRLLGVSEGAPLEPDSLVCIGMLPQAISIAQMVAHLEREMGQKPLHIGGKESDMVQKIAWCTGAAQGYLDAAVAAGADLYVTGEVSEQTVHTAREEGIHFFAAGHHATERYGVQAVGEYLAEKFDIEHRFIDISNPV